jgi:hypothetical protein
MLNSLLRHNLWEFGCSFTCFRSGLEARGQNHVAFLSEALHLPHTPLCHLQLWLTWKAKDMKEPPHDRSWWVWETPTGPLQLCLATHSMVQTPAHSEHEPSTLIFFLRYRYPSKWRIRSPQESFWTLQLYRMKQVWDFREITELSAALPH